MTLKLARLGWNRFPKSLQSYKKNKSWWFWSGLLCSLKQENMGMLGFLTSNIHVLQAWSLHPPGRRQVTPLWRILSHELIFGVAVLLQRPWTLDSQNKQKVLIPVFHLSFLSKKIIQMKLCGRVFVLKQAHLCQLKASFRAFFVGFDKRRFHVSFHWKTPAWHSWQLKMGVLDPW